MIFRKIALCLAIALVSITGAVGFAAPAQADVPSAVRTTSLSVGHHAIGGPTFEAASTREWMRSGTNQEVCEADRRLFSRYGYKVSSWCLWSYWGGTNIKIWGFYYWT